MQVCKSRIYRKLHYVLYYVVLSVYRAAHVKFRNTTSSSPTPARHLHLGVCMCIYMYICKHMYIYIYTYM